MCLDFYVSLTYVPILCPFLAGEGVGARRDADTATDEQAAVRLNGQLTTKGKYLRKGTMKNLKKRFGTRYLLLYNNF